MTPETRQKLGLPEMAAYYEGYADGMTAVVERWSKSLGRTHLAAFAGDALGEGMAQYVARQRTVESDREEDR